MDPAEAFGVGRGDIVAVVGAGGKKSTLYALTAGIGGAVLTATVHIPPFEGHVGHLVVAERPSEAVETVDEGDWPLGLVPDRDGDRGRYLGYDPATVDALASATDAPLLVKADGARRRRSKAPADDEPQVPASSTVVVPVVSVRVVGEPLSEERVHRSERVAAIADLSAGEEIGVDDVVAVLTHESGGLKRVPEGAAVRPLVNMVDDDGLEATARRVAEGLLGHRRVDRVVLGRMDLRKVVDVVECGSELLDVGPEV